jgi:hypothetical protein
MTTQILTQTLLQSLLDYDPTTGMFKWRVHRAGNALQGQTTGSVNTTGYIQVKLNGVKYSAHRLAWLYVYGSSPDFDLDHINRNRQDNRIVNLRKATRSQNCQNQKQRVDNTSGVKGIHWCKLKQRWIVQAIVEGKRKQIGAFTDREAAISARAVTEKQHYPFKVA